MNINILKEIKDDNLLGETLRHLAFEYHPDEVACYGHFNIKSNVSRVEISKLDPKIQEIISDTLGLHIDNEGKNFIVYKLYESDVLMAYFYDADGTLLFLSPSLKLLLVNHDCKKNYGWEKHGV